MDTSPHHYHAAQVAEWLSLNGRHKQLFTCGSADPSMSHHSGSVPSFRATCVSYSSVTFQRFRCNFISNACWFIGSATAQSRQNSPPLTFSCSIAHSVVAAPWGILFSGSPKMDLHTPGIFLITLKTASCRRGMLRYRLVTTAPADTDKMQRDGRSSIAATKEGNLGGYVVKHSELAQACVPRTAVFCVG